MLLYKVVQMEIYHFVTHWSFEAPIDRVWAEIIDGTTWPEWLQDFRKVTPRQTNAQAEIGAIVDIEYRGDLPYTFRFSTEIIELNSPHLLTLKAFGDLIGQGKWQLEDQGNYTIVTYYWDVSASNPIFDLFMKLPFARRLSEQNHNKTMERAFQSLKTRLQNHP
jgi:Polyketide cyclase / dehydrase and lipid transport